MTISEGIEQLILNRQTSTDIMNLAIQEGMVTLRSDGFQKIKAGLTSIEEVLRVVA
jgi:type IV pilus assembly protein PilB